MLRGCDRHNRFTSELGSGPSVAAMTNHLAMISGIGVPELLIVLALALIVLGPKRLPGAGRALGSGLREFKDGVNGRAALDARRED